MGRDVLIGWGHSCLLSDGELTAFSGGRFARGGFLWGGIMWPSSSKKCKFDYVVRGIGALVPSREWGVAIRNVVWV